MNREEIWDDEAKLAHLRKALLCGTVAFIKRHEDACVNRMLAVYDGLSIPVDVTDQMWVELGGREARAARAAGLPSTKYHASAINARD